MKKFIILICILIISCSLFTGCNSNTTSTKQLLIQNWLTLYHVGDKVELLNDKLIEEYESVSGENHSNVYTDYIYSIQVTNNDIIIVFSKTSETFYKDKAGNLYTYDTLPDDVKDNYSYREYYSYSQHTFYEFSLLEHPDWIRPIKN